MSNANVCHARDEAIIRATIVDVFATLDLGPVPEDEPLNIESVERIIAAADEAMS